MHQFGALLKHLPPDSWHRISCPSGMDCRTANAPGGGASLQRAGVRDLTYRRRTGRSNRMNLRGVRRERRIASATQGTRFFGWPRRLLRRPGRHAADFAPTVQALADRVCCSYSQSSPVQSGHTDNRNRCDVGSFSELRPDCGRRSTPEGCGPARSWPGMRDTVTGDTSSSSSEFENPAGNGGRPGYLSTGRALLPEGEARPW